MSESTRWLALPCLAAGQAQKHVTVNEALIRLDALLHLSVLDRDLAAPPLEPAEGDRYIVAADAEGHWEGHDGRIALWLDAVWHMFAPNPGWRAWVEDEGVLAAWDGTAWVTAGGAFQNVGLLGLGTEADETNPFSARLNNALWTARYDGDGGDGSLRYKLNKEEVEDTASLLFQTDWSGRAEIGLVGGDDLVMKVSEDGDVWTEAMRIDRDTGAVTLNGQTPYAGDAYVFDGTIWVPKKVREHLSAARTYYANLSGNDSNTGLDSGDAFATLQKAIDVVATLDTGIHNVTILAADGTWTQPLVLKQPVGAGTITLRGNVSTPANCHLHMTAALALTARNVRGWHIEGFKLGNTSGYSVGVYATDGSVISVGAMEYGTGMAFHTYVDRYSVLATLANYAISGGSGSHLYVLGGTIFSQNRTVTFLDDVTFTQGFARASTSGYVQSNGNTYSLGGHTVTGARYAALMNGTILTSGAGADYFPGSISGAASTGGQYA